MNKKLLLLVIGTLFMTQISTVFACDIQVSNSIINEAKKISYRYDAGVTIVYTFTEDWYRLTKEKKYKITSGLGQAEICTNEDAKVILIFAEKKEVAKYNKLGTTKLYEYE